MAHIYPQDFKYGIINSSDLSKVEFDDGIYPTSPKDLRYSVDGSQFVIKWDEHHTPHCIEDGELVPISILSWADCHTLMQTPEWTAPDPFEKYNKDQTEEFNGDDPLGGNINSKN